jgi:hypothetical protein
LPQQRALRSRCPIEQPRGRAVVAKADHHHRFQQPAGGGVGDELRQCRVDGPRMVREPVVDGGESAFDDQAARALCKRLHIF